MLNNIPCLLFAEKQLNTNRVFYIYKKSKSKCKHKNKKWKNGTKFWHNFP